MAVAIGVIIGLVNAGLTLGLGINSFIVTLAMLSIVRGLAYTFTDAAVQNAHNLEAFRAIGTGFIVQLPVIGRIPCRWSITAVIFAVFAILLTRTTLGRYIYAVGGNPRAAGLSGVRVNGIKTLCFVITSVLAALSAFLLISRMNSGRTTPGSVSSCRSSAPCSWVAPVWPVVREPWSAPCWRSCCSVPSTTASCCSESTRAGRWRSTASSS